MFVTPPNGPGGFDPRARCRWLRSTPTCRATSDPTRPPADCRRSGLRALGLFGVGWLLVGRWLAGAALLCLTVAEYALWVWLWQSRAAVPVLLAPVIAWVIMITLATLLSRRLKE